MVTERTLVLYHTAGCHLCELAQALVAPIAAARGCSLSLAEISGSDELEGLYGTRIPVLRTPENGREIGWPFGESELLSLLADD
jgi:hypothetical protein